METCETCRFFLNNGILVSRCRRYPPWIECEDQTSWPIVRRDDWCGEHQQEPTYEND